MMKMTVTLMPGFPSCPSCEHEQLWQVVAESLSPRPCPGLSGRCTLVVQNHPYDLARSNLGPEARVLPQPPQGLDLSNPILWQPCWTPAGSSGDGNSKALCHHTLGTRPAKRGKGQARAGVQADNQLPLDFMCSWRRYSTSNQGRQECQGQGRL